MNFPGAVVALIGLWIVVILSSSVKTYIESLLIPGYFTYLRQLLFEKTVNSYQAEYRDVKTGEYLTRALELTRHIKDLFQYLLSQFLPELIVSLMIVGYMFVQHATLGWILLAGCIICAIIQYFGNAELFKLIIDRENFFNTTVSENLRDSLDNLMNVFLNNTVDHEIEKNASLENKSREKLQRIMSLQGTISFMTDFIIVATFIFGSIPILFIVSIILV
jgi:ABC-type multidrug transport system fused ATPase/permease subunit